MKEIISKLQELGLSRREAEIYLALLTKKELTAPEIAKITSVSRTKCYEILQNLTKRKVCNSSIKNKLKYFSAIEPKIAFQNLIDVYEDDLNRRKSIAEKSRSDLAELFKGKMNANDPLDYIEIITDIGQVRERWFKIQKNAKKELLGFTKQPYIVTLEENIEDESKALQNKVMVKGVYEYKNINSPEEKQNLIKMLLSYQELGEELRLVEELPMKLVVSDEKIVMFTLDDRVSLKSSITTMVIDHPNFAGALKKVFESYWASAITLEEYSKRAHKRAI